MKSVIKPPADGFSVNIHRNPNPFSSEEEPDWVFVSHGARKDLDDDKAIAQRSLIPPGSELLDTVPTQSGIGDHNMGAWEAKETPLVARDMKTPPPIPRKPVSLSARESQHSAPTMKYAHHGQGTEQSLRNRDEDPRRRITKTGTKCGISSLQGGNLNSATSLPISRGPGSPMSDTTSHSHGAAGVEKNANDLLDDSVDGNITWKPLLPQ